MSARGSRRRRPILATSRLGRTIIAGDPGLQRLMAGWRMLVSVAVGILVGAAASRWFGEPTVIGVMIGGLMGFVTAIGVSDNTPSGILKRCSAAYVPFLIGLPLSLALHPYRWAELVLLIVLLFVHMYANAFGPYGHDFGTVLFAAFLSGLLLPLSIGAFVSLAAISALALIVVIAARLLLCRMRPGRLLAYALIAFTERVGDVLRAAERAIAARAGRPAEIALRRLRRQTHLLNEAALLADACLAQPDAATGAAEWMHRLVFDMEQDTQRLAVVVASIVRADPDGLPLDAVRQLLQGLRNSPGAGDPDPRAALRRWLDEPMQPEERRRAETVEQIARLLRLAEELDRLAEAWRTQPPDEAMASNEPFASSVSLLAGKLPGSTLLSRRAVTGGALSSIWASWRVSPHLRTAIQAGIAVAIVTPLADLIDPDRFYWADIGVLIIVTATTSTHDRLRKLGQRVLGTVIGGTVGILLCELTGTDHSVVSCILITLSISIGAYCLGSYYTIWVAGLVAALCQLYNVSVPVTDTLLLYRLLENLLGAVVGILVALVVLPLSTRAVARYGMQHYFAAFRQLLERASAQLGDAETVTQLRRDARAVDSAAHELDTLLDGILPVSRRSRRATDELRIWLADLSRNARGLAKAASDGPAPTHARGAVTAILSGLGNSANRIAESFGTDAEDHADGLELERYRPQIDRLSGAAPTSDDPAEARLRRALLPIGIIDDVLAEWAMAQENPIVGSKPGERGLP